MSEYRDKNILSSVNHTLKILDLLCVRTNLGVSEISRITGYDKASVYKMLYTLQHRGYVLKDENARYNISDKLAPGVKPAERQSVSDVAEPYLKRLRNLTHETVMLGVLNTSGRVVILAKEDGNNPDSLKTRVAFELDAYSNALGKVLLSHLDPAFLEALGQVIELYPLTPNTVTDKEVLKKQLIECRQADYYEQYDENYIGHSDISAPIFDSNGRIVAGLSVACPTYRLKEKRDIFITYLKEAAAAISKDMGYIKAVPDQPY